MSRQSDKGSYLRRKQSEWHRQNGDDERRRYEPMRDPNLISLEEYEVRQKRAPSNEWPEPIPLPKGLSPVEAFDTKLLPATIAPWVCDVSERMQCPPDYVGAAALVALGSVLGRKVGIRPQRKTDWFEVANLWGLIVGRPGVLKSPAIHEALKPLHRLEAKAAEAFDRERVEYLKAHQDWKLRKEAAEQRAKAALKKDPSASVSFDLPEPEEPVAKRYVTNDTTYEKLGEILAQNPNGVLAHRDELVSLLKTLDREEYAGARGFFLTAWNGTMPYRFDRISRGKTHIEAACLSMLGSTQPARPAEYVRPAMFGAAGDDGLIQRFGMLIWPDQPAEWHHVDRYPDSHARQLAWQCFESFDGLRPEAVGAARDEFRSVPVLGLDEAAYDECMEWRRDLEDRLRSGELHPALEAHLAKYRKLVPALALINHLADNPGGEIGKDAMLRALGMASYLETHARRAYGAGPEAETTAAKAIVSHIRRGDLIDGFSARDVHQRGWSNLSDRNQVRAGLSLLCDLCWLCPVDKRLPAGGRPTTHYRINPRAQE
jgi:putative DNA primase/helicase